MQIRNANELDIEVISEMLVEYINDLGELALYGQASPEYRKHFIEELIRKNICIIAEQENQIVGLITGLVHPHIYNPEVTAVTELFWYVLPSHRQSLAAAKLFSAFKLEASRRGKLIYFNLAIQSQVKHESITKRGFSQCETHFVMQV